MPLLPNSFERRRKLRNFAGLAAVANRGQRGAISPRGEQMRQTASANNLGRSAQNLHLRSPRSGVGPAGFKTNSRDRRVVRNQGLAFLADKANRSRFQDDSIDQPRTRQGGSHGLLTIDELQQKQGIEERAVRDDIRLQEQVDFNRDLDERDFENEQEQIGLNRDIEQRNFEAGRTDARRANRRQKEGLAAQVAAQNADRGLKQAGQDAAIGAQAFNQGLADRKLQADTDIKNKQLGLQEKAIRREEKRAIQKQKSESAAQYQKRIDNMDDDDFFFLGSHGNLDIPNLSDDERSGFVGATRAALNQGFSQEQAGKAGTAHILDQRVQSNDLRLEALAAKELEEGSLSDEEEAEFQQKTRDNQSLGERINSFKLPVSNRVKKRDNVNRSKGLQEIRNVIDQSVGASKEDVRSLVGKLKKKYKLTDQEISAKFPSLSLQESDNEEEKSSGDGFASRLVRNVGKKFGGLVSGASGLLSEATPENIAGGADALVETAGQGLRSLFGQNQPNTTLADRRRKKRRR